MSRMLSFSIVCAAGALALCVIQPASAADAEKEISTAAMHAGMAAGSADMKMVQSHFHHVINCLVGPKGTDYDAAEADPCKGMGDGAMVDAPMDKHAMLSDALTKAKAGLGQTDASLAKADALQVEGMLNKAK